MWFYELIQVIVNAVPLHTWIGMWFYELIRVIVSAVPLRTWIGMWFYKLSAVLYRFYTLCFCIRSYLKVKLQYGFYALSWCYKPSVFLCQFVVKVEDTCGFMSSQCFLISSYSRDGATSWMPGHQKKNEQHGGRWPVLHTRRLFPTWSHSSEF